VCKLWCTCFCNMLHYCDSLSRPLSVCLSVSLSIDVQFSSNVSACAIVVFILRINVTDNSNILCKHSNKNDDDDDNNNNNNVVK